MQGSSVNQNQADLIATTATAAVEHGGDPHSRHPDLRLFWVHCVLDL